MYKRRRTALSMLPNNPQAGWSAIENTRYARVGVSTFFRGQVSSGGDDAALLFTTDTQLHLLHDSHVNYVDLRSGWCRPYIINYSLFSCPMLYSFPVCYVLMTRKTTALYRATAPAGTTICSYAAYRRLRGCSSHCLSCCFPALSCLAFSTLAIWCRIFMSRIFSRPLQAHMCTQEQSVPGLS